MTKEERKAYYAANREKVLAQANAYNAAKRMPGMKVGTVPRERIAGVVCAISEHFVLADLLSRGYQVTKPFSPTSKHDLHVELPSVGWKGIQVKGGILNKTTQSLTYSTKNRSHPAQSPILAVVHFPTHRIDYRAGTEPLPVELTTELEKSIRSFEKWQRQPNN